MVMIYSLAKVQGQRAVGSEDRVETNGQTDGGDCITCLINAVGNNRTHNTGGFFGYLIDDTLQQQIFSKERTLPYIIDLQLTRTVGLYYSFMQINAAIL